MDNTTHVPLLLPRKEPHSLRKFSEAIAKAVKDADTFLKKHPNGPPNEELEAFFAKIDAATVKAYENNMRAVCAITGAYYCAVSSGITGSATRRYIGALGQCRLTMALMLLRNSDREILGKFPAIRQSLAGAKAVARVASALNAAGGQCHLPTAYEDADLKIDLLCVYKGKLACIQVKLGERPESHIADRRNPEERELLNGVALFNTVHKTHGIPLWVSTITFSNVMQHAMHNEQSIACAAEVLELLQPPVTP